MAGRIPQPFIDDVVARCSLLFRDEGIWQGLKNAITSIGSGLGSRRWASTGGRGATLFWCEGDAAGRIPRCD